MPAFNPGEDGHAGLFLGIEAPAFDEFILEASEDALRHGVVVGIAKRPHRRTYTYLTSTFTEGWADVMANLVAVINHILRLALVQRHVQC